MRPCPCCHFKTLNALASFEICPVCFWQDDGQNDDDASVIRGGPNGNLSLEAGRANFIEFGASRIEDVSRVRPPLPWEL